MLAAMTSTIAFLGASFVVMLLAAAWVLRWTRR